MTASAVGVPAAVLLVLGIEAVTLLPRVSLRMQAAIAALNLPMTTSCSAAFIYGVVKRVPVVSLSVPVSTRF